MVRRRILGGTFEMIDAMAVPESLKRGFRTKAAIHALFNRGNLEYYPGSSRESYNRDPRYTAFNHDGYAIVDGVKIPIKSRGSKHRADEYGDQILFLPFRQLVLDALQETTGAQALSGKHADEVALLLQREAYGEALVGYERTWTDTITHMLEKGVTHFAANRLVQPKPGSPASATSIWFSDL